MLCDYGHGGNDSGVSPALYLATCSSGVRLQYYLDYVNYRLHDKSVTFKFAGHVT